MRLGRVGIFSYYVVDLDNECMVRRAIDMCYDDAEAIAKDPTAWIDVLSDNLCEIRETDIHPVIIEDCSPEETYEE